jgi:tubulin beta
VYYNEASDGKYIPRAFMVDFESDFINSVKLGRLSGFFKHDNLVTASSDPRKTWFKISPKRSMLYPKVTLHQRAMSALRQEAERCECFQGFQLTHSLGGGTGSGMGSLLMAMLREQYPKKILNTYSVLPTKKKLITEERPY